MRNRLVITLALGLLAAVVAAGAVSAQSSKVLEVGGTDISINLPGELPILNEALPACSNLIDDDGDGLVDLGDPDCDGPLDNDEAGAAPAPEPPAVPGGGGKPPSNSPDGGGGKGGGKLPSNLPEAEEPFEVDEQTDGVNDKKPSEDDREPLEPSPDRNPDGSPTNSNPTTTIAPFGPAPIGVPNVVIDSFAIPPFLLPIYQACGTQYGIPWQVLASINRIETAFGTNLNVSTAGALGWMQFMPATWKAYGVDANGDGRKDPYNPVDAICAAARYLNASGGETDLPTAIFAYNHADWYVDEVLLYAREYGALPTGLVNSLTGLTEGAHFPVAAKARYADDISEREAARRATPTEGSSGNVADVISDSPTRRGIDIYAAEEAPVVAVNDGIIQRIGKNDRLGNFIVLEDAYGNLFTYAELGAIADAIPVPKQRQLTAKDFKLVTPGEKDQPASPASQTTRNAADANVDEGLANTEGTRERLYALPERPANRALADLTGQLDAVLGGGVPGYETFKAYFTKVLRFDPEKMESRPLEEGSKVIAGTVIGRVGEGTEASASHLNFAIEPAGRGAHKIDPKPILDGWKLLEATAIYRAAGKNPFDDSGATVGQILLMSKAQLQQRLLKDPGLEIYSCGREDIQSGQIDRRIMATLAYLSARGFDLTVTSLKCGRAGIYTTSGSVSHHVSGNAVDIAQINGIPILGNQGRGSLTEAVISDLLALQGAMTPAQIISLMEMGGNTFAMGDHDDHIHVGFQPLYGPGEESANFSQLLSGDQWDRLLQRIGEIDQPTVPTTPSDFALPTKKSLKERASNAHIGE